MDVYGRVASTLLELVGVQRRQAHGGREALAAGPRQHGGRLARDGEPDPEGPRRTAASSRSSRRRSPIINRELAAIAVDDRSRVPIRASGARDCAKPALDHSSLAAGIYLALILATLQPLRSRARPSAAPARRSPTRAAPWARGSPTRFYYVFGMSAWWWVVLAVCRHPAHVPPRRSVGDPQPPHARGVARRIRRACSPRAARSRRCACTELVRQPGLRRRAARWARSSRGGSGRCWASPARDAAAARAGRRRASASSRGFRGCAWPSSSARVEWALWRDRATHRGAARPRGRPASPPPSARRRSRKPRRSSRSTSRSASRCRRRRRAEERAHRAREAGAALRRPAGFAAAAAVAARSARHAHRAPDAPRRSSSPRA